MSFILMQLIPIPNVALFWLCLYLSPMEKNIIKMYRAIFLQDHLPDNYVIMQYLFKQW